MIKYKHADITAATHTHLLIRFPITQLRVQPVHHLLDVLVLLVDGEQQTQEVDEADACQNTACNPSLIMITTRHITISTPADCITGHY